MPNSTTSKAKRPPPVRKPKSLSKKKLSVIEKLASKTANNATTNALKGLGLFKAPVRTGKKASKSASMSKKQLGDLQKLASQTVKNATSNALKGLGIVPVKKSRPKPARKSRAKPKSFVNTSIGNPYAINMVFNNPPTKTRKASRPKPSRPKASRSKASRSITLNTVGSISLNADEPVKRIMTFNQLVQSNPTQQQAMANAERNAKAFKSAFAQRMKEAKARKKAAALGKSI